MDEKSEMIDRIRNLITRDSKNKSQILRELHLSTSTLSDWEKGKGNPSSSAVIKLARYFNVSSDYILFGPQPTEHKELTPPENKWLALYDMFTETQKQELADMMQSPSGCEDITACLSCFSRLSVPERKICTAFVRGILAEKNLHGNE